MSKIRIFQFPIKNTNGGITHYAMNNWKHIDKSKFECDFGTLSSKIDFENSIYNMGARLKHISCYAEENQDQFINDVKIIFINGSYDIVHIHTPFWKSFLVEQIAIDCKIPRIIVHSHSTSVDVVDESKRLQAEKLHQMRKEEFNTSLATDFCACSRLAADWLFGEQIPRDKIKILKNAIEVDKFLFNKSIRDKYRFDLGLDDCFVIGHVGRMAYPKNHEFLLNVFAEVSQKISNVKLLLVGEGPLKNDIKAQADLLGITNKIIFTGLRNDVHNILQAMDVFVLPSRFEGLGIVLVEALSSGLKCIASNAVPDEINICDNISFLPLIAEKWRDSIIEIYKGYERENMYDVITEAGYNIKYQIKEVQRLYTE